MIEQELLGKPVHDDILSPYGQEGPSHGVALAGQAKQHLDLTLEKCWQELPVTVAHTSDPPLNNGSVESPNGQFSKVRIVKTTLKCQWVRYMRKLSVLLLKQVI